MRQGGMTPTNREGRARPRLRFGLVASLWVATTLKGRLPVATAAIYLIGTSTETGLACVGLFSSSPRLSASCVDCVTTAMPGMPIA